MLKSVAVIAVATSAALMASRGLVTMAASAAPAPAQAAVMIAPSPQTASPAGVAQISKAADGHYWAEAEVDGRWMRFLVDTGASAVALTTADAQRLGVDTAANGDTMAAPVTLDHLSIAGARVDRVEALVVRDGLQTSLLGMSYLGRLSRFEATPTSLILRP